MTQKEFDRKRAVILGSTGSIGFRVAELLARRGATVVLNGRSAANGLVARNKLSEQGFDCRFEIGDAGVHDDMKRVSRNVAAVLGAPDVLICSGGAVYPGPTPFLDLEPEQILQGIQDRIASRLLPVHAFAPLMRDAGGGVIVLVTSDAARHPTPGEVVVGAAGAAVLLATKALSRELMRWQIRVNCVAITLTSDTKRYAQVFDADDFGSRLFSKALERFPSGRAPSATDVAEAVAFLASPRSAEIAGQTVSVNGGLSYGGW